MLQARIVRAQEAVHCDLQLHDVSAKAQRARLCAPRPVATHLDETLDRVQRLLLQVRRTDMVAR